MNKSLSSFAKVSNLKSLKDCDKLQINRDREYKKLTK